MITNIKKYKYIIIFVPIGLIILFLLYSCNYNMNNLPKGEFLKSSDSPNKEYTLNAYRHSGGATMDWTLRVELVNNKTGKVNNIYWKYHDSNADMKWIDYETIEINGKILNIYKDKYDWRKD